MSTTRSTCPKAPVIDKADQTGVILCAHGTGGAPGPAAFALAEAIRACGRFDQVELCCLKGRPDLDQALARMTAARIHVVPLLMADGYTGRVVLPAAIAGLAKDAGRLRPMPPIGIHPGLTDLIGAAARATCLAQGWRPAETALVLLAHGTARDPGSARSAHDHVRRLAARAEFAAVGDAFLEQPPSLAEVLAKSHAGPVVMVGLFAERGIHGDDDAVRLARESGGRVVYAGPIGCAPGLAALILDSIAGERP
jgi:sirohydrochlorin cobaltochelatase